MHGLLIVNFLVGVRLPPFHTHTHGHGLVCSMELSGSCRDDSDLNFSKYILLSRACFSYGKSPVSSLRKSSALRHLLLLQPSKWLVDLPYSVKLIFHRIRTLQYSIE